MGALLLLLCVACCDVCLLRAPPQSRVARFTSTTGSPRNVMQRHPFLYRLHAHTVRHDVDFIGGDFNMSAFSTVGDVFTVPDFAASGNAHLWGSGGPDESRKDCTGFLTVPQRPHTWRVQSHGCYMFDNAGFGFAPSDLSAHFPVSLSTSVSQCHTQRPSPTPST